MIEAELPDGRILEFPAGTDPAVVQSTVKKMLGVPAPLPDGSYSDMTPKRQVGAGEALGRGIGSTFAGQGKTLALAAAAPAMLVDAVGNWFRDKPSTAVQDAVFGALVDPAAEAVRTYAVNPNTEQMGGVATAANIAGNLIGMAPSMIAGGAAQAGPRLAAMSPVVQNLVKGAVAAQPSFALPATVNRASDLLDAGVDGGTVAKASAANLAANTLMGALPVSKAGGLLTRAATGAGLNLASGAAARGAEGAILGDQYANLAQDPFGAKEMGTDAGIGAAMAMLIGPRAVRAQAAPVPPRPDVLALPPPDTTNVIRVDPQGVARPELASEGAVADLVADMTGQRRPPPPAALPDRGRVIEGEAVRVPDPELPAPGVQQNRPGATMRVSPEGVARAETPEEQRQRTEQQTQAETAERHRREELGNESPDAPDPRFNDNPPRTEAPNARPDTSGARSAGPGDAAARSGGNDGAVDRQPGAAPRDANARAPENGDQRQPSGGEGPARTDGNSGGDNRNSRVADPRDVPRLQVEHEKVRTQAKKNRTAIGNLEREIASPEFKALPEKKQAAVRDRLAKARTQLKAQEGRLADIAEALTPERMPKRESEGMTLMQALRKKGGVTPEMARDMGIDAKDSKTVNKKGLADENQIEFALDDLDMLRPGEKYADVVQRLERELKGEGERTETDLEREANAREREGLEAEARKYGIDPRDMTRQQVLDALEREQAKGQSQADMDEANSAAEFARQEAMDGRTIDDLLDEVGVTDKDIEDAKYRREAEVESKAAADEAERARAGGDEAAPVPEHSRPAEQARADEVRPQPEPGNEPPGGGPGKGDGADGGQEPAGGAPSRDYPGRAAASRLNALPLDAVWETFKKSLGNSKQWREYVDFLGETTKDFFKRLTDNPKAALKSLVDASKTSSGENAAASAIRLLNEDLGRRARIIVDKFDSPTARKVLDMMDFEMGRGEGVGTVFREAMQRRLNVGLNGLKPVLEAVAAAEDSLRAGGMGRKDAHAKVWEAVIERVENPGMSRSGHIGAAAKAVEGWYKELLDMQREAGVDIGDRGPAYFTVRYDADKIAANPDAFTRDITEAYKAEGVAADEARARAEALTTAKLRGESVELVGMLSGSASSVTKERDRKSVV